eukprot:GHRQ01016694.1.p1 GENE.GHRQ01016694.1~~GHRQ01016694.1.p1  ORF type:complete len:150 (-),score=22.80 GHRQ01016694.1:104-553(-)
MWDDSLDGLRPWRMLPELISAWQVIQVVSSGRNASHLQQQQQQQAVACMHIKERAHTEQRRVAAQAQQHTVSSAAQDLALARPQGRALMCISAKRTSQGFFTPLSKLERKLMVALLLLLLPPAQTPSKPNAVPMTGYCICAAELKGTGL